MNGQLALGNTMAAVGQSETVGGGATRNVEAGEMRGRMSGLRNPYPFSDNRLFHNYLERFIKNLPVRELF